ncbi:hypothetical protein EON63_07560, partial [archaeon]
MSPSITDADFWFLCCRLALCGDLLLLAQLLGQHGSVFVFPAGQRAQQRGPAELQELLDILLAHPYTQHKQRQQ